MSQVTAELNDLATQAILKPADGGGYNLTVTDGCDVIVVRLGDHGVGQVALALASYKPAEPLLGLDDINPVTLRQQDIESAARAALVASRAEFVRLNDDLSDVRSSAMAQHPAGKGGES